MAGFGKSSRCSASRATARVGRKQPITTASLVGAGSANISAVQAGARAFRKQPFVHLRINHPDSDALEGGRIKIGLRQGAGSCDRAEPGIRPVDRYQMAATPQATRG